MDNPQPPFSILNYLWQTTIAVMLGIVAYFSKRQLDNIDSHGEKIAETSLDLEKFKTHVAANYVKENSLERVHDRIDDMWKELGGDIKKILEKLGER